jgi:hypothetical protein
MVSCTLAQCTKVQLRKPMPAVHTQGSSALAATLAPEYCRYRLGHWRAKMADWMAEQRELEIPVSREVSPKENLREY